MYKLCKKPSYVQEHRNNSDFYTGHLTALQWNSEKKTLYTSYSIKKKTKHLGYIYKTCKNY